MIDYDSFSLCRLTDIFFFAFHVGAKELKESESFFATAVTEITTFFWLMNGIGIVFLQQ